MRRLRSRASWAEHQCLVRRSRGLRAARDPLPRGRRRPILAVGAELKNTFALVRDGDAFSSQHLGDLDDEGAYRGVRSRRSATSERLFELAPEVVAHDLHPGYRSTRYAQSLEGVERVASSTTTPTSRAAWPTTGSTGRSSAWHGTAAATASTARLGRRVPRGRPGGVRARGHFECVPHAGWRCRGPRALAHGGRLSRAPRTARRWTTLDLDFMRRLDRPHGAF